MGRHGSWLCCTKDRSGLAKRFALAAVRSCQLSSNSFACLIQTCAHSRSLRVLLLGDLPFVHQGALQPLHHLGDLVREALDGKVDIDVLPVFLRVGILK